MLALVAGVARADLVRPELVPVRFCTRGHTIDKIEACLKKLGNPVLVHTFADARLYRLVMRKGHGASVDVGLSLYVHRGDVWRLGGTYEARGLDYDVLAAEPLVIGKHAAYRIDVGEWFHGVAAVGDHHTRVPALLAHHQVMLCSGNTVHCDDATIACDVLVRGAAVWTFRGVLQIVGSRVDIVGDRSHTGPQCEPEVALDLGWARAQ